MARLLYVIAHSTDAPERARTALTLAAAAAEAGHEVACWLVDEGVRLAVAGLSDVLDAAPPAPATACLDVLAAANAVLHTSRPCFEARRFEADVLRPAARLAEPRELGDLVADGWAPVPT